MIVSNIDARDLSEAWFLCLRECMDLGYKYTITKGSHEQQQRLELDSITLRVRNPESLPLVPSVPDGVPAPTDMAYIERYLPYLICGKSANEQYTYGDDIQFQLPYIVKLLKQAGEGTNQACMSIGNKESVLLDDPQCLRVVDLRIRNGRLHIYVYFRSWDLWAGFPSNLAAVVLLQQYIALEADVRVGELIAYSKGLHLYGDRWKYANMVLGRDGQVSD